MKPDDEVCLCYHVSLRKIVNFIERERPAAASQVSECLSAGTGCGWCRPFLRKLHRDLLTGGDGGLADLPHAAYEQLRSRWLDADKPARDPDRFADEAAGGGGEGDA